MNEENKNMEAKNEDSRPLLLHVEDLIPILGISRSAAYLLVHKGEIRSVRIGRSIRIPRGALDEFVRNLCDSHVSERAAERSDA
jgi:excisionase family DNA binding protein